ncbi:MAG: hypothetical protein AAF205_10300 [Pseudomonadota bacterium]
MTPRPIMLLPALLLAGCFEPDSRVTAEPETETVEMPKAPPADPRRFIGRWAEAEDKCATDWYRFWADELRTKTAGLLCDIRPPDASFSDEVIRTACRDGNRRVADTWQLSYSDDAREMTIVGESGRTIELVRC